MKSKQTKRALISSALALVLCFVMLLGTTFAWFTDNASTSVNKVQAGTLDVALEMADGKNTDGTTKWVSAEGKMLDFVKAEGHEDEDVLWEPNCTYELPQIRIVNNGNLALKYKVYLTAVDNSSTTLGDVIEVTATVDDNGTPKSLLGENETAPTLNEVMKAAKLPDNINSDNAYIKGKLEAGKESGAISISLHMKGDAGNTYQGETIEGIAVTVVATQDTVESDSKDNQYDADAQYATLVSSAEDLTAAIQAGGTISLAQDITANDIISITKDVTIIGNGKTITAASGKDRVFNVQDTTDDISIKLYGLTIANNNNIAYDRAISFYNNSGKIRLEMDNCTVTTQHYALNIAKNNTDIEVIVKNSNLTGYAAVQTWSANSKLTFENCTLKGVNKWDNTDNDFCTVNVTSDAENAAVTLKNCTIQNTATGTATQRFFGIEANGVTVTATGCTYISNGKAVAASDVSANAGNSYIYTGTNNANSYTLTIN